MCSFFFVEQLTYFGWEHIVYYTVYFNECTITSETLRKGFRYTQGELEPQM